MTEKKSFKELAEERRSATYFDSEKELDDELLEKIINLAVLAPSSFNSQPWKLIAVKSEDKRKELYEEACNQPKVLDAPVVLAVLGDKEGYKEKNPIWDVKLEEDKVTEEKMEGIINYCDNNLYDTEGRKIAYAVRNSSLFAMSIMYAAKYYGVDTHPMIGFDAEKVKELYDIDDNMEVTMLMTVGYFDESEELYPREKRFKYDEIVEEF